MTTAHLSLLGSFALVISLSPSLAQAQEISDPPELETVEELMDFLDSWSGSPEELAEVYDDLASESRAFVDSNFEFWSIEGGLSLLGGAALSPEVGFKSRLVASLGAVWPFGDYPLPVYYALPEIPGPWALGFQVFAGVEDLDTFVGGASFRYAHEYIGETPYLEVGPMLKANADGVYPGAHLDLGFGSIIYQGYIQGNVTLEESAEFSVLLGFRLPWLVFYAL